MYEVSIIKMYDKTKVERETHTLDNIDEIKKEFESLRWKYKDNYLSMSEYVQRDISEETLHIELWCKNKYNDIWRGAGDYFFLQDEELEKEIKDIVSKNL